MKNYLLDTLLGGEKGIKFKNLIISLWKLFDLVKIFKLFLYFKKNLEFFDISSDKFLGKLKIKGFREEFRINILKNFFPRSFFISDLSIQILREIWKRKKKGILQYQLAKKLNMRSNYIYHIIVKLSSLGLIRKKLSILKIDHKISNIILIKPFLKSTFFVNCKFRKNFNLKIWYKREKNIVLRLMKTFARRFKNILTEKSIKYGIFFVDKMPKKINKRKIHRTWQKIRSKCQKSGFFLSSDSFFSEKNNRIKIFQKSKFEIYDQFTRKKKRFLSPELKILLFSSLNILIKKIFILSKTFPVTSCYLSEKFRGYFNYKNIHLTLNYQNVHKNLSKTIEQIGRQKILHFKKETKNFFEISKKIKGTTEQAKERKKSLITFIKSNVIPLNQIGKFIANNEKKGLKRIDSKVIKRVLKELIHMKLLRFIKIRLQLSFQIYKKFVFIGDKVFKNKQVKTIFEFLSFSYSRAIKKIKLVDYTFKIFSYPKGLQKFLSFTKLLKIQFWLNNKIRVVVYPIKDTNLIFNKKKCHLEKELKFKNSYKSNLKKTSILMIYLGRLLNGKAFIIYLFFQKKSLNFINNCLKKMLEKIIIFEEFFEAFFCQINWNLPKARDKNKKKFFKKNEIVFRRLSFNPDFSSNKNVVPFFQDKTAEKRKFLVIQFFFNFWFFENTFSYSNSTNLPKIYVAQTIWDSELDVNLFSNFLSNLKLYEKKNSYIFGLNIFRKRLKRLSSLKNLRNVAIFLKKNLNLNFSTFIPQFLGRFDLNVKRALEFPQNFYNFDLDKIKQAEVTKKRNNFALVQYIQKFEKLFFANFFANFLCLNFLRIPHIFFIEKLLQEKFCFKIFFILGSREKNLRNLTKKFFDQSINGLNIISFTFLRNKILLKNNQKSSLIFSQTILVPLFLKSLFFFMKVEGKKFLVNPFFLKIFSFKKKKKGKTFEKINLNSSEQNKKYIQSKHIELRVSCFLKKFLNLEKDSKNFYIKKKNLKEKKEHSLEEFKKKCLQIFNNDKNLKIKPYIYPRTYLNKDKMFYSFPKNFEDKIPCFSKAIFKKNFINPSLKIKELIRKGLLNLEILKKFEYLILENLSNKVFYNLNFISTTQKSFFSNRVLGLKVFSFMISNQKVQKFIFKMHSNSFKSINFDEVNVEKDKIKTCVMFSPNFQL